MKLKELRDTIIPNTTVRLKKFDKDINCDLLYYGRSKEIPEEFYKYTVVCVNSDINEEYKIYLDIVVYKNET